MADLVKKIKIKKQDGTFTDYIPIGAEAQNISTSDGDSVQLKLNKKPYYYNNVADMKADTKLKVGDMAITLGDKTIGDGLGAYYKISDEETDIRLNNGLYAQKISNIGGNDFKDLYTSDNYIITTEKITDSTHNLIYHKTILTPNKADYVALKGEMCTPIISDMNDNPINLFEFSTRVNSIFMSNADSVGSFRRHAIVRDGKTIVEGGTTGGDVLAITKDGNLLILDGDVTATQLLNEYNVENSWGCSSIVRDGEKDIDPAGEQEVGLDRHPRTVVCQEYDSKDIIFLHIDGRKPSSNGVTFDECADFVLEIIPNIKNACCVGGGGDTQLMIKGRILNDCNDKQLRPLYDIFYLNPNLKAFGDNVTSEIGNARMSEETLHDFLKSRVNLDNTFLKAKGMLTAELLSVNTYNNRFICNEDYNINLKENDTIIVTFPDLTNNQNINVDGVVSLNIHYALEHSQVAVKNKYGYAVKPGEISNKTVLLKWNGNNYIIIDMCQTVGMPDSVVDLDNITDNATIYSSNFTNRPTYLGSNVGAGIVMCIPIPIFNYAIQIYLERPNRHIYMRCLENGSWNAWARLSDNRRETFNGSNLNDLIDLFHRGYGNNMTNKPSGASNGWIINLPGGTAGYNAQIYIERQTSSSDGRIYLRLEENGTWGSWKQIAFVS